MSNLVRVSDFFGFQWVTTNGMVVRVSNYPFNNPHENGYNKTWCAQVHYSGNNVLNVNKNSYQAIYNAFEYCF